jgi:retinol dehydrogenase-12
LQWRYDWEIQSIETFVAANCPVVRWILTPFLVLNVFFVRELKKRLPANSPVIVIAVNPGYCKSQLRRHLSLPLRILDSIFEALMARTTEEGSRQLVWAAIGGAGREFELRGAYVNKATIQEVSDYALSDEGAVVQTRIWVRDAFSHNHRTHY